MKRIFVLFYLLLALSAAGMSTDIVEHSLTQSSVTLLLNTTHDNITVLSPPTTVFVDGVQTNVTYNGTSHYIVASQNSSVQVETRFNNITHIQTHTTRENSTLRAVIIQQTWTGFERIQTAGLAAYIIDAPALSQIPTIPAGQFIEYAAAYDHAVFDAKHVLFLGSNKFVFNTTINHTPVLGTHTLLILDTQLNAVRSYAINTSVTTIIEPLAQGKYFALLTGNKSYVQPLIIYDAPTQAQPVNTAPPAPQAPAAVPIGTTKPTPPTNTSKPLKTIPPQPDQQVTVGRPVQWRTAIHDAGQTVAIHANARNIVLHTVNTSYSLNESAVAIGNLSIVAKHLGEYSKLKEYNTLRRTKGYNTGHIVAQLEQELSSKLSVELPNVESASIKRLPAEGVVTYETEAPQLIITKQSVATEELLITSDTHYVNIVATYNITPSPANHVKLMHKTNGTLIPVDLQQTDTDADGLIDRITWIVPHLSNQSYILIYPTDAIHLDENKLFVRNVFSEIIAKDGITAYIPENQYIRVTFETNLTSVNDITIAVNPVNGSLNIDVFRENTSTLVAQFRNITENGTYKRYLTNLTQPEDTFDLLFTNSDADVDWIIDPVSVDNVSLTTTSGFNLTEDNLTCNYDLNDTATTAAVAWYLDGNPYMTLYLPYEGNTTNSQLDYSGNANNVSNRGNAAFNATGGYDGFGATFFDGSGDYQAIQKLFYSAAGEIGNYTVCAWVNSSSTAQQMIISFDRNQYWRFALKDDRLTNNVGWDTEDSTSAQHDYTTVTDYADGTWHHVCGWFEPGSNPDKAIYVDGVAVQSVNAHGGNLMGNGGATRYGFIGVGSEASGFDGSRGPTIYFNGHIDDVRIYDHALTQPQIQALADGDINTIVSNQTNAGEVWSCVVTPFNSSEAGPTVQSNNITIINDIKPNITLTAPVDLYSDTSGLPVNLTFNATAVDDNNVTVCSLYHNIGGAWGLNQSVATSGASVNVSFNLTNLVNVTFIWNVECNDSIGRNDSATSNRTVILEASPPEIVFVDPTAQNDTTTQNYSILMNATINESTLKEIIVNVNGTNQSVYADGTVLYFNFDNRSSLGESASLVRDLTRHDNDGTPSGASPITTGYQYGGYSFDGTNDIITVSDDVVLDFTETTIEVWINTSKNHATSPSGIVSKGSDWSLYIGSDNAVHFKAYNGTDFNNDSALVTDTVNDGAWHHIAVKHSSSNIELYLDGILQANQSFPGGLNTNNDDITIGSAPVIMGEVFIVAGVTDAWQQVNFTNTYNTPVVVCTRQTSVGQNESTPRLTNVTGTNFMLRSQNPENQVVPANNVHCIAVEEGSWTLEDGTAMEAFRVQNEGTNENGDWTSTPMENVGFTNAYTQPVILGQVMTQNDSNWSVFWNMDGTSKDNPPSNTNLYVGKHVGESNYTLRNHELIGYIVVEQASGTINTIDHAAAYGADSIEGFDNGGDTYALAQTYAVGIADIHGMDGGDGGWAVLYGASPMAGSAIDLVADEDTINDAERSHTAESVNYWVFDAEGSITARAYFDGYMDEFSIWNESLPEKQFHEITYTEVTQFNNTQWFTYTNHTKAPGERIDNGNYTYQMCAIDLADIVACTEERTIEIFAPQPPDAMSPANNTRIDRDEVRSSTPDNVSLLVDTDVGVVNVSFYLNGTDPYVINTTFLANATTNTTGYANITYDPNSTTFAGNYTWYANTTILENGEVGYISVVGSFDMNFSNESFTPDANYTQNETLEIFANATSLGPETRTNLTDNYSMNYSVILDSPLGQAIVELNFTDPFWNNTFNITSLGGVGVWNATLLTQADFFFNATANRSFEVYGYMNVSNATLPSSNIVVYQTTTQTCTVIDTHTAVNIQNANVSFYLNATLLGTNLTNASGQADFSLTPTQAGNYTVTCNITDDLSQYYYASAAFELYNNLTVERFNMTTAAPANNTHVDRDSFSASVPDFILLNISLPNYVPDGLNITFRSIFTNPQLQSSVVLGVNTTNSSNAIFYYDPNSSSFAGNHTWYATADHGDLIDNRTYHSYGALDLVFSNVSVYPQENYTINETVLFRFNLTSQGPENRSEIQNNYSAEINFTVASPAGTAENTTTYAYPFWNGTFRLLNLTGVGVWNVTANASADYFYNTSSTYRNFTVYDFMNVTSITVTHANTVAYMDTNISCTVQSQFTSAFVQNANVSFFRNATLLGTALTNGSGVASLTFNTSVPGNYNASCSVSNQTSIYYFAGDEPNATASLNVSAFNITTAGPSNATRVDRDSANASMDDAITLNVTVPSFVPDGITFTFYANVTEPVNITNVVLGTNTSNTSNITFTLDPNSSHYAGNWTWWVETPAGYLLDTRFVYVFGDLIPVWRNDSFNPDANYTINQTIIARNNLTSSGAENRSEIATNYNALLNVTYTSPLQSAMNVSVFTDPYWESNFSILNFSDVGLWNATANATAYYHFAAGSTTRGFTVFGYMNVTSIVINESNTIAYQSTNATCTVQRQFTGAVIQNANVSFYRDATLIGTALTNASGEALLAFNTSDAGQYNVTCSVSDQTSLYFLAGDAPNATAQMNVSAFNVTLNAPTNGTAVDRDSANATLVDILLLNVSVPSFVPDGVSLSFYANVTSPVSDTNVLLGINTTSSSEVLLWFDPNSTHFAGNWSWWANASSGEPIGTRFLFAWGDLSVTWWNGTFMPDANYTVNETITARNNLTSPGAENRSQLANNYSALINITYTSPTQSEVNVSVFTDPYWESNFSIFNLSDVGVWNITANATAQYHFPVASTIRNTTVYGYMNVTAIQVNHSNTVAYQDTNATCTVQRQFTGGFVQNANVSFYRNATLVGTALTNATGVARITFNTSVAGQYNVTCSVSDQPSIYFFAGDDPNATAPLNVSVFNITLTNPANDTAVDRDSANATMSDVILLNVSVPSYIPDGVTVSFYANATSPISDTNLLLGTNTTSSSTAILWFDPNSSNFAGNYTWWANASVGQSINLQSFLVFGDLALVWWNDSFYPDENYTQNQTIVTRLNLTSSGAENRSQIATLYAPSVNVTYNSPGDSSTNTSVFTDPYWENNLSAFNMTDVGIWNATGMAYAEYHFPINSAARNLTMFGYMNVTSITINNAITVAYFDTNATCTVHNQFTNAIVQNANVSFYRDATLVGTALTNASGHARLTFNTSTTGQYNVTCAVSDQTGIYYYAGDAPNATAQMNVSAFNVTLNAPTNGTAVDRDSANATLIDVLLLNVSVPSFVPDGVPLSFYANVTSPVSDTNVLLGINTTSSSEVLLWFDPNSTHFAGNWSWWANASSGEPLGTRFLFVWGDLSLTWWNNSFFPDVNYTQNESVVARHNLTSSGAENRSEIATSYNAYVNVTFNSPTLTNSNASVFTDPYWEGNLSALNLSEVGPWNLTASALADYHFPTNSTYRNTTVFGFMNVTSIAVDPANAIVYFDTNVTCSVHNQFTGGFVQSANVSFYRGGSLLGSALTNSSGSAMLTFNTSTVGQYNVTCSVSDQPAIYYLAGDAPNMTAQMNVSLFNISLTGPANGTSVDRDSANATMVDVILLNVTVPTTVPNGTNISFYANVTDPISDTEILLGTNTTNGLNALLWFNPNSSHFAGNWSWWANTTAGESVNNRYFYVFGDLSLTWWNNSFYPDENYTQNGTIVVRHNLTSSGAENRSQLNTSYGVVITTRYTSPVGTNSNTSVFTDPYWENNMSAMNITGVGVWNATANATANYHFLDNSSQRNFTVYGYMNITGVTISSNGIPIQQNTSFTCSVGDQHTSVAVQGANVSFYVDGLLIGTNLTNSSGQTTMNYTTVVKGLHTVTCNMTDQVSIYYFAGDSSQGSATLNVTNTPPTHSVPVLNVSDNPVNSTFSNMTVFAQNISDVDNDTVSLIYDWRRNGSSIATVNIPLYEHYPVSTVQDYSDNSNNGTIYGALNCSATGKFLGGCAFDASTTAIDVGDIEMSAWDEITVMAWINTSDTSSSQRIVSKDQQGTQGNFILWFSAGSWEFIVQDTGIGGWQRATWTNTSINDGQWHFIVGTVNQTTDQVYLYVDGVLVAQDNFSAATLDDSDNEEVVIGADSDVGSFAHVFNGSISNVQVHNYSLSEEQIFQMYMDMNNTELLRSVEPQETQINDSWVACLTPHDGDDNGSTSCSNAIIIREIPFTNLTVFSEQNFSGVKSYAGHSVTHFANWTLKGVSPINITGCQIRYFDGTTENMTYNGALQLWESYRTYYLEGSVFFNASCDYQFYLPAHDNDTASIQSVVSLSAHYEFSNRSADDTQHHTVSVTNYQNYTEYDINLSVFFDSANTTYNLTPTYLQNITGQHTGTLSQWYFPNLTTNETRIILINASLNSDYTVEPVLGISTPTVANVTFGP